MKLKNRLKAAREHIGLTQKGLAEKSGVKQQTISRIETGQAYESPGMIKLAIACNIRPEWLQNEEGKMLDEKKEILSEKGDQAEKNNTETLISEEGAFYDEYSRLNDDVRYVINFITNPPAGKEAFVKSLVEMIFSLKNDNVIDALTEGIVQNNSHKKKTGF